MRLRKTFFFIVASFLLHGCIEKEKPKKVLAQYYTLLPRMDSKLTFDEDTLETNRSKDVFYFKYTGKNTRIFSIKPNSNKATYINNNDSIDIDSLDRRIFYIGNESYLVFRLITGLYSRDGTHSYYLSPQFGLLGDRSETWRGYTKIMTLTPDTIGNNQLNILADAVFNYDEWMCHCPITQLYPNKSAQ